MHLPAPYGKWWLSTSARPFGPPSPPPLTPSPASSMSPASSPMSSSLFLPPHMNPAPYWHNRLHRRPNRRRLALRDYTRLRHLAKQHTTASLAATLLLFEANLLQNISYDDAILSCSYVIHTASLYKISSQNSSLDLLRANVQVTINLLSSCVRASVSKLILTSSIDAASIALSNKKMSTRLIRTSAPTNNTHHVPTINRD